MAKIERNGLSVSEAGIFLRGRKLSPPPTGWESARDIELDPETENFINLRFHTKQGHVRLVFDNYGLSFFGEAVLVAKDPRSVVLVKHYRQIERPRKKTVSISPEKKRRPIRQRMETQLVCNRVDLYVNGNYKACLQGAALANPRGELFLDFKEYKHQPCFTLKARNGLAETADILVFNHLGMVLFQGKPQDWADFSENRTGKARRRPDGIEEEPMTEELKKTG